MINDIQIPAVSALTSVDAIAIRSIVNALLNEIVMRELSSRRGQRDRLRASRFTMWVGVPWMKLTTLVNAALK